MPYATDPARYPELARAALFRNLPASLVTVLAPADRMSESEVASRLREIYPIEASGIGGPEGRQPWNYGFKLTSKRARVRSLAETSSMAGDERPSSLVVGVGFTEPESDTPKWIHETSLGFRVPWTSGRRVVAHLAGEGYRLAMVSDDGTFGFAVSAYIGYLPKEYDDGETVYRVARWRPYA